MLLSFCFSAAVRVQKRAGLCVNRIDLTNTTTFDQGN